MPEFITIGEVGSIIQLEPKSGLIATEGIIRDGNCFEIENVFGTENTRSMKAPVLIDFFTIGTQNPLSTKSAGKLCVYTYTTAACNSLSCDEENRDLYEVDMGCKEPTFKTTAGQIRQSQSLVVSDPITYYRESVWSIRFLSENIVPEGGFIKV